MFYITKIISLILLSGPIDENGWVSVEPLQKKSIEQKGGGEIAVWPVFSRQFGVERVLIRFPTDPSYGYPNLETGDSESLFAESTNEGFTHRLHVQNSSSEIDEIIKNKIESIEGEKGSLLVFSGQKNEKIADFLYRDGGKWVRERIIRTPAHLYVLQTFSDTLSDSNHQKFISTFDLEIRDKNKVFHREIESEK